MNQSEHICKITRIVLNSHLRNDAFIDIQEIDILVKGSNRQTKLHTITEEATITIEISNPVNSGETGESNTDIDPACRFPVEKKIYHYQHRRSRYRAQDHRQGCHYQHHRQGYHYHQNL